MRSSEWKACHDNSPSGSQREAFIDTSMHRITARTANVLPRRGHGTTIPCSPPNAQAGRGSRRRRRARRQSRRLCLRGFGRGKRQARHLNVLELTLHLRHGRRLEQVPSAGPLSAAAAAAASSIQRPRPLPLPSGSSLAAGTRTLRSSRGDAAAATSAEDIRYRGEGLRDRLEYLVRFFLQTGDSTPRLGRGAICGCPALRTRGRVRVAVSAFPFRSGAAAITVDWLGVHAEEGKLLLHVFGRVENVLGRHAKGSERNIICFVGAAEREEGHGGFSSVRETVWV